jgi:hypothetical protein
MTGTHGRMADSTQPWLIPDAFSQRPNGVAGYPSGDFAWSAHWWDHFPRHVGITTLGATDARVARWIDVERGAATPAEAETFLNDREAYSSDGGVYCSRSSVPAVLEATGRESDHWWWIATLDNHHWTPAELAADIARLEGVTIRPERILAIQWRPAGHYDESSLWAPVSWTGGAP